MTTLKALRQRWQTEDGKGRIERLMQANSEGVPIAVYRDILTGLDHLEEVPSGLDFRGMALPRVSVFRGLDLSGANFEGAKLSGGFSECILDQANLDRTSGRNVNFSHCQCHSASFHKAKLPGGQFWESDLSHADFSQADLQRARLNGANLRQAILMGADLRQAWVADADLRGADLRNVNASAATFGGVQFDGTTLVKGAVFSAQGLDPAFSDFVTEQGGSDQSSAAAEMKVAEIQGALAILKQQKAEASLQDAVAAMIDEVKADPDLAWTQSLRERLSETQMAQVLNAATQAISQL